MQEIQKKNGVYCQTDRTDDRRSGYHFLSFPEENTETQKQFLEFDRQLRKTSKTIYELSGRESGTLRLLRRTGFRGYRLIRKLARKRNNMEE